jgi:hypothetical protein
MKKLITLLTLALSLLIFSSSCQNNTYQIKNFDAEAFARKNLQIKEEALRALEQRAVQKWEKIVNNPNKFSSDIKYHEDFVYIRNELDANEFVNKYHSDVLKFYTTKYINLYKDPSIADFVKKELPDMRIGDRIEELLTDFILGSSLKMKREDPKIYDMTKRNGIMKQFIVTQEAVHTFQERILKNKRVTAEEKKYWKELEKRYLFYEKFSEVTKKFNIGWKEIRSQLDSINKYIESNVE